jgi:sterol desaturase/sphingolipid hydroxylase (fatty acid hydroxylase superfamily)
MSKVDWKIFTPFYFYPVTITLLFAITIKINNDAPLKILLLIFSGFLLWQLLEYTLHRFLFHLEDRSKLARLLISSHMYHHQHPNDPKEIFVGLKTGVPVASFFALLMWIILGDWSSMIYMFTGLIVGYLLYESIHYLAHCGKPTLPLLRYLKRYHLLHHHQTSSKRFGVTTPLLDLLLGTFQPAYRPK